MFEIAPQGSLHVFVFAMAEFRDQDRAWPQAQSGVTTEISAWAPLVIGDAASSTRMSHSCTTHQGEGMRFPPNPCLQATDKAGDMGVIERFQNIPKSRFWAPNRF